MQNEKRLELALELAKIAQNHPDENRKPIEVFQEALVAMSPTPVRDEEQVKAELKRKKGVIDDLRTRVSKLEGLLRDNEIEF